MAITVLKVGLDPKRQIQTLESLDSRTNIVTTTITAYYMVEFSAAQSDPTACYVATDGTNTIPKINDSYSANPNAPSVYRVRPELDPQSVGRVYRVQVDYSNAPLPSTNSNKWDFSISIDGLPITESYYYDLDNYQVTNSAAQNFAQQPSRTYYGENVVVSFKTSAFDELDAETLQGQINSAQLSLSIVSLNYSRVFPAATLQLNKCRSSTIVKTGVLSYWQVALDMTYRPLVAAPSNCKTKGGTSLSGQISTLEYDLIIDQGFAYVDSSTSLMTSFCSLDQNGNRVPSNAPGLLNGSGGAILPNGSPATSLSPTAANYIAFRKATRGDFSALFSGV